MEGGRGGGGVGSEILPRGCVCVLKEGGMVLEDLASTCIIKTICLYKNTFAEVYFVVS